MLHPPLIGAVQRQITKHDSVFFREIHLPRPPRHYYSKVREQRRKPLDAIESERREGGGQRKEVRAQKWGLKCKRD